MRQGNFSNVNHFYSDPTALTSVPAILLTSETAEPMATALDIQCAHGTRSFRVSLNFPEYLAACQERSKSCSVFTLFRLICDPRISDRRRSAYDEHWRSALAYCFGTPAAAFCICADTLHFRLRSASLPSELFGL